MKGLVIVIAIIALLSVGFASADIYYGDNVFCTSFDGTSYNGCHIGSIPAQNGQSTLPIQNIFDWTKQQNRPITDYSYEQLTEMMGTANFQKWNDMNRVCDTLEILFGRTNQYCGATQTYPVYAAPATARAYAQFTILPQPTQPAIYQPRPILYPVYPPRQVVYVDPVYPPWSPTYNPYW